MSRSPLRRATRGTVWVSPVSSPTFSGSHWEVRLPSFGLACSVSLLTCLRSLTTRSSSPAIHCHLRPSSSSQRLWPPYSLPHEVLRSSASSRSTLFLHRTLRLSPLIFEAPPVNWQPSQSCLERHFPSSTHTSIFSSSILGHSRHFSRLSFHLIRSFPHRSPALEHLYAGPSL
jgi:hypothetical protein